MTKDQKDHEVFTAKLLQRIKALSRELVDARHKIARLERHKKIYSDNAPVEVCKECDGFGGWPEDGQECNACNTKGWVRL